MSTNIDNTEYPDAGILERLANQLFNEGGAYSLPGHGNIQHQSVAPQVNDNDFPGINTIPSGALPGLEAAASSPAAGIGTSPSIAPYSHAVDAGNGITPEPAQRRSKSGEPSIPASVAGSGASPSAVEHGNNINISNPQTGFPDQNIERKENITPMLKDPFHLASLNDMLPAIHLAAPSAQLPFHGTGIAGADQSPAYYFLPYPAAVAPSTSAVLPGGLDLNIIKKDFPILQERVNGKPVIWLDNAATTQKPRQVIERISYFYEHENSNIHRAAHHLAARATDAYEEARKKIQFFINAASSDEIIFVRGTTEAINLVAKSWGEQQLVAGDEIILTHLEHHANIVPWQQLAAKKGLKLRIIPVDDDGQVLLDEYANLLNPRTKLVSFTWVSNALGTVTPAKTMIDMAHQAGAKVLLDGAQSVSHMRTNVRALDADWFVFSGHKVFGPTGIGVLYGKDDLLNQTQPWQGGGNMIKDVTFEHTQYQNAPSRFEAGTGNIADAVGLGAAIDYVSRLGIDNIYHYEHFLLKYATGLLQQVPGLKLVGTAKDKTSVLSFILNGFTNDQVGQALNNEGIAVRTGHHCAQPILRRFGLESTVRPSLAFYNTCADIDVLVATLYKLKAGYA